MRHTVATVLCSVRPTTHCTSKRSHSNTGRVMRKLFRKITEVSSRETEKGPFRPFRLPQKRQNTFRAGENGLSSPIALHTSVIFRKKIEIRRTQPRLARDEQRRMQVRTAHDRRHAPPFTPHDRRCKTYHAAEMPPLTRSAPRSASRARSIALRTGAKHPTNHVLEAVAATPDAHAPEESLSVLEAPSSTPLNAGMKLSSQAPPSCQK